LVPVFEDTVQISRSGIREARRGEGDDVEKQHVGVKVLLLDADCHLAVEATVQDILKGVRKCLILALLTREQGKYSGEAISSNCGGKESTSTYRDVKAKDNEIL
jgi:hypothetical protein